MPWDPIRFVMKPIPQKCGIFMFCYLEQYYCILHNSTVCRIIMNKLSYKFKRFPFLSVSHSNAQIEIHTIIMLVNKNKTNREQVGNTTILLGLSWDKNLRWGDWIYHAIILIISGFGISTNYPKFTILGFYFVCSAQVYCSVSITNAATKSSNSDGLLGLLQKECMKMLCDEKTQIVTIFILSLEFCQNNSYLKHYCLKP